MEEENKGCRLLAKESVSRGALASLANAGYLLKSKSFYLSLGIQMESRLNVLVRQGHCVECRNYIRKI